MRFALTTQSPSDAREPVYDILFVPVTAQGVSLSGREDDLNPFRVCAVPAGLPIKPGTCVILPSALPTVQYVSLASCLDHAKRPKGPLLRSCLSHCAQACRDFAVTRVGLPGEMLCWECRQLPDTLRESFEGAAGGELVANLDVVLFFKEESALHCARGLIEGRHPSDRRRHRREERILEARVSVDPAASMWMGTLQDISRGGVRLVLRGTSMPEGVVEFRLDDSELGPMFCRGRIVWCQKTDSGKDANLYATGVEWIGPIPAGFQAFLDSMTGEESLS